MRLLCWHVDYIKWRPTHEVKGISEPASMDWNEVKECIACLIAVEQKDESNPELINQAIKGINEVVGQVKVNRIVLYPYAHLSNSLSKPLFAKQVISKLKELLISNGFEVFNSPFGWDKEFEVHCKGHPLAETARII